MRQPHFVTAAVLAAALGLGACGGKALTKNEYIKQADAICKDVDAQQKKLGEPKSLKDVEKLADATKPIVQDQIKKLRDLKAPDELKDQTNSAYDLLDQQVPKIDELKNAAKANDAQKIQSVAESASKLSSEANKKAKEIGLQVCGS